MNFVTYVAIAESTLVANEMSNAYHDDTPKESSGHRVLGVSFLPADGAACKEKMISVSSSFDGPSCVADDCNEGTACHVNRQRQRDRKSDKQSR